MELVITLLCDRVLEIQCLLLSGLLLAFRTGFNSVFILAVSLEPTKCLLQSKQAIDMSHYISDVLLYSKYLVQIVNTCARSAQYYASCGRRIVGLQMT